MLDDNQELLDKLHVLARDSRIRKSSAPADPVRVTIGPSRIDQRKRGQVVMDAAWREGHDEGRTEGFADGFAAAIRMMQEFFASAKAPKERFIPKGRVRVSDVPYAPRINGGKADRLVEDAYQFIAPKVAGPTEIQRIIKQRDDGDLPGTSTRRAIARLMQRGRLRRASQRTWVYQSQPAD